MASVIRPRAPEPSKITIGANRCLESASHLAQLLLTTTKANEVTHQPQDSTLETALELISQQGFASMADAIRIVVNEAMKLQRTESLDAQPHERSDIRRGYANGFKTMTVSTRVGKIQFAAPQVRDTREGERFYPSDL